MHDVCIGGGRGLGIKDYPSNAHRFPQFILLMETRPRASRQQPLSLLEGTRYVIE